MHRRTTCTAALLYEDEFPDEVAGAPAIEGEIAHTLMEECLLQNCTAHKVKLTDEQLIGVSDTMRDYIDSALARIYSVVPEANRCDIHTEMRVEFEDVVPDPQGAGGTADVMYVEDATTLWEWDLKYGYVPVSPLGNAQLLINAYGFLREWEYLYPNITTLKLVILQPRLGRNDIWTTDIEHLRTWVAEKVTPNIELSLSPFEREFTPEVKACEWCKARFECKARAKQMEEVVGAEFGPVMNLRHTESMTMAERIEIYPQLESVAAWCKDLQDSVAEAAVNRHLRVPGYSLVQSTRTHRRFHAGMTATELTKKLGLSAAEITKEIKLKSVAQVEKLIDKKNKPLREIFSRLWVKPPGQVQLVKSAPGQEVYDPADGFPVVGYELTNETKTNDYG